MDEKFSHANCDEHHQNLRKLEFGGEDWHKFSSSFTDAESAQMQNIVFMGGFISYRLINENTICVVIPQENGEDTQIIRGVE